MRGEYKLAGLPCPGVKELPPRARRIPSSRGTRLVCNGTTSACAENTPHTPCYRESFWNYLRVRGEYKLFDATIDFIMELPPRARRIPNLNKQRRRRDGTTSACAENTNTTTGRPQSYGNYLRVRGEYLNRLNASFWGWELPPRARRIRHGR